MSDNWFVQHPEVMRYILEHETQAANPIPIMYRAHDEIRHTDATPFCDDARCPCHSLANNGQTFIESIEQPIADGLLTTAEGLRLYWGEQI